MSATAVTVTILDREYAVSCPPEEHQGLIEAAAYLDARMRAVRSSAKLVGLERIAVMAALNIAHESIQAKTELRRVDIDVSEELRRMNAKLEAALSASVR
jgi:cell division protein ZapA